MAIKNRYQIRSRITTAKFRRILFFFCEDQTASKTAKYTGINRNTVNKVYDKLRIRIAEISVASAPEQGEFEVDESYFGAKRVRGKRGRGAAGKTPVFGILKKGWKSVCKHSEKG